MAFKFYAGNKATIPTLEIDQPGFARDTGELFVGTASGNVQIGGGGGGTGDVVWDNSAGSPSTNDFPAFSDTTGQLIKASGYGPNDFATATHNHDAAYAAIDHVHEIGDLTNVDDILAGDTGKFLRANGVDSTDWQFPKAVNAVAVEGGAGVATSNYHYGTIDFQGSGGIVCSKSAWSLVGDNNTITVTIDGSGVSGLPALGSAYDILRVDPTGTFAEWVDLIYLSGVIWTTSTQSDAIKAEGGGIYISASGKGLTMPNYTFITNALYDSVEGVGIEDYLHVEKNITLGNGTPALTAVDLKFWSETNTDFGVLSYLDGDWEFTDKLLKLGGMNTGHSIIQIGIDSTDVGNYVAGGGRLNFGDSEYIQHNNTLLPGPPDFGVANAIETSTHLKVGGDLQANNYLYLEAAGGSITGIYMGPEEVAFGNIPRFYYDTTAQEFTANRGINLTSVKAADSVSVPFDNDIDIDTINENTTDVGVTIDGLLIKDGDLPNLYRYDLLWDGSTNVPATDTGRILFAGSNGIDCSVADDATFGPTVTVQIDSGANLTVSTVTANFLTGNLGAFISTIYEKTTDAGVTIDSLLIKDGGIPNLISGLTADAAPTSDDYVMTYESTGGTNRKVLLSDLPSGSSAYADEAESVVENVANITGSTITAGTPVYITGYNSGLDLVNVAPADADGSGTMPALGIVVADISTGTSGRVILQGSLHNIDTSSWSTGDSLYVSTTAGVLTSTRPTGATTEVQKVGTVLRSHATLGSIFVTGANRSNDVPNIADGKFWQGNSSGVATEVELQEALMVQIEGTVDEQIQYVVPFDIKITGWTMLLDASGSMQVDVWKDTYANHPPTDADSWVTPSVTSAAKNQATGLSLTASAGDILIFNVDSVTTATLATVALTGVRTS